MVVKKPNSFNLIMRDRLDIGSKDKANQQAKRKDNQKALFQYLIGWRAVARSFSICLAIWSTTQSKGPSNVLPAFNIVTLIFSDMAIQILLLIAPAATWALLDISEAPRRQVGFVWAKRASDQSWLTRRAFIVWILSNVAGNSLGFNMRKY